MYRFVSYRLKTAIAATANLALSPARVLSVARHD
jgi:hypothetical protein